MRTLARRPVQIIIVVLIVSAMATAAFGAVAIAKKPGPKPVETPYMSQLFYTYPSELTHNQFQWVWLELDRGFDVEFQVIPTADDVWLHAEDYAVMRLANGQLRHALKVEHREYLSTGFKVRARIYSINIASDDVAEAASDARMRSGKQLPS